MESHKELMHSYLCESLRELMTRSVFEKITIKQICDRTGVIRATFYNYFDDKYDCLNAIVKHDISEFSRETNTEAAVRRVLSEIDRNRDFYRAAYNVTGQNGFEDMVRRNLAAQLKEYLGRNRKPAAMNAYSNDLLARYFAECIAFDIREFVFREDDARGVDGMTQMVIDLMRTSLVDLLG